MNIGKIKIEFLNFNLFFTGIFNNFYDIINYPLQWQAFNRQ